MTARASLQPVTSPAGRVPPHNLEAEAAVLSAILLDKAPAVDRVAFMLRPEHFYSEANRRIYEACLQVRESEQPIDLVTVVAKLRDAGRIGQAGGPSYVAQIMDATPSTVHVEAHALIVIEKARVRTLIAQCQKLAAIGYGDEDPASFVEQVRREIEDACAKDEISGGRMVGAAVSTMYQRLVARGASKMGMGVPTGFIELDEHTSGLHSSEVTYVAARPGMGKTSLVLGIARNIAYGPTPDLFNPDWTPTDVVAFFSLEMPEEQVTLRLACMDGGVDSTRLKKDILSDAEWGHFTKACERIAKLPIWVDDKPLDIERLRAQLLKLRAWCEASGKKLRVAIIDYVGLMDGPGKDEYQRITENSKQLKRLSKEMNMPIVALCQLNRAVEERGEKRPGMSDLRGSGALEQDADNIWFLFREDYYRDADQPPTGEAEVIIAKQRNGPFPKTAHLKFYAGCTRFDNA